MTAVYHLAGLSNLPLGHQLSPHYYLSQSAESSSAQWTIPTSALTAREIVTGASPLFDSVVYSLGSGIASPDDRKTLIESLSLSLSTSGRETTLPLPTTAALNSRRELYAQAQRIGETLTQYVNDLAVAPTDPGIRMRSHCDGHLWSLPAAALLTGARGGSDVMMLYNEWLHQMVLLRDALLPFENFEEVRLLQTAEGKGMRALEKARKLFLADLTTGQVSQSAIVQLAMALTARTLIGKEGGYGFQYGHGVVLPASLNIGGSSSLHLLRYHPARVDESQTEEELLFEYEYPEYFAAARAEAPDAAQTLPESKWPPSPSRALEEATHGASLLVQPGSSDSSRVLSLELSLDETRIRVDLGQIARGQRFAYRLQPTSDTAPTAGLSVPAAVHMPKDILVQSGLVTSAKGGVHIVPADSQLVVMVLLGKIYPENVILVGQGDQPAMAEAAGKGYGARFIIWKNYE